MSRLLSLVARASAFEPKCITCKHFIADKCKLFPLIANLNDDIVHGYDYINCNTAMTLCKRKYYDKIELIISQETMSKNEYNLHYVIGVRRCS